MNVQFYEDLKVTNQDEADTFVATSFSDFRRAHFPVNEAREIMRNDFKEAGDWFVNLDDSENTAKIAHLNTAMDKYERTHFMW